MLNRLLALALLLSVGCSARTRPADVVPCTPGSMIRVGCDDLIGRFCSGDPTIRVCEGETVPAACVEGSPAQLAFDDDSGTAQCPFADLLCPASGRITVVPNGSGSWVCAWEVGTVPVVPSVDRAAETLSCTPGAMLAAGCDGTVGTICRGDPVIRVCEGSLSIAACSASSSYLVEDDDGGATGNCPRGNFTCPPSGRITVVPRGFSMSSPTVWDCLWDVGAPAI